MMAWCRPLANVSFGDGGMGVDNEVGVVVKVIFGDNDILDGQRVFIRIGRCWYIGIFWVVSIEWIWVHNGGDIGACNVGGYLVGDCSRCWHMLVGHERYGRVDVRSCRTNGYLVGG